MEKTRLNIELFKKIRERIATIPESYDQEHWWQPSVESPCGTTACLAGEAIICNAPSVEEGLAELKRLYAIDKWYAVPNRAAELLGLDGDWPTYIDEEDPSAGGETVIFDAEAAYWPLKYMEMFQDGDEAGAAVAYLTHIIETGNVFD